MDVHQLIFVYNSDSGLFSSVADFAHKVLSPSAHKCKLCALTYGNISVKLAWKEFIERLPLKIVFLHKDEFLKKYKKEDVFPAVFYKDGFHLTPFLSKENIEQCESLQGLMEIVSSELAKYDQRHHSNI